MYKVTELLTASDDCTIFECVVYKVTELLTAIVMTVLSLNVLCIKLQNYLQL